MYRRGKKEAQHETPTPYAGQGFTLMRSQGPSSSGQMQRTVLEKLSLLIVTSKHHHFITGMLFLSMDVGTSTNSCGVWEITGIRVSPHSTGPHVFESFCSLLCFPDLHHSGRVKLGSGCRCSHTTTSEGLSPRWGDMTFIQLKWGQSP